MAPDDVDDLRSSFLAQARGKRDLGADPHDVLIAMRAATRELAQDGWEPDAGDRSVDGPELRADGGEDTVDSPEGTVEESPYPDEPWWTNYPRTTTRAVPVTEATAGVDVTILDMDSEVDPFQVLLREYYPPEDDVDGGEIMLSGASEVLELATALLGLVSHEFDAAPLHGDELEDSDWSRQVERDDEVDDEEVSA